MKDVLVQQIICIALYSCIPAPSDIFSRCISLLKMLANLSNAGMKGDSNHVQVKAIEGDKQCN